MTARVPQYVFNRLSLVGFGVFGSYVVALIWWSAAGEMPPKAILFAVFCAAYLSFRFVTFRSPWRAIEEVLFVCVYGAGGTIRSFTEFSVGSPVLVLDLSMTIGFLAVGTLHLVFGAMLLSWGICRDGG